MHIVVLGSSSAGNCTAIWNQRHVILVDCGFSPRYINGHLRDFGIEPSRVSGLLITHTHSDHVNEQTLEHLFSRNVRVVCPEGIVKVLARRFPSARRARDRGLLMSLAGAAGAIGDFGVEAFDVPHDADGRCFGYSIRHAARGSDLKITIATDLGYPRDGLSMHFADSDAIVIESNHDAEMLENSSRPAWLKRRIREIGHLSNDQCAAFLVEVLRKSEKLPTAVILAHISQECNTNPLAMLCTRKALDSQGFIHVDVVQTHKTRPHGIVTL